MDREDGVNLVNGDKIEATVVIIPDSAISNVNPETTESSHPLQTVVIIDSDGESAVKNNGTGLREDLEKMNVKSKMSEGKENQVLVNVNPKGSKGFTEERNGEMVCRICHLGSNQTSSEAKTGTSISELVQLGCDCKDELGIAHSHCAEAWFKLKGNRMCEICSEIANNIEGVGDSRFMEEWNEGRSVDSNGNTSNRCWGCLRGQPFCNFLMACLVIAFVLPWFLRVNIF